MSNDISKQICKICEIKKKRVTSLYNCEGCKYLIDDECNRGDNPCKPPYKYVYPNFENNVNELKLINLLIENDHIITMSKDYYAISNGDNDFIDDCYEEHFEVEGSSFLEALYNYLTRWIKEKTSFKKEDGTMSEYIDTSHTLEREDCYYPRGFDDYLKDIDKIKKAIRQAIWKI